MAEEDTKEQEENNFDAGSLFKDVEGFVDIMSRVIDGRQREEEGKSPMKVEGLYRARWKGNPRQDFQIKGLGTIAPQGAEVRREVAEERSPVVDIFDEGDVVLVVVELPGVSQENIRLEFREDIMALSTTGNWERSIETLLPCAVEPESLTTAYKNSVLEIRLRKCTD